MGEKWTLPRSLSNLAEGSKSGETNANPKQVKPQDRPIGEFRSREPGFKSGWGHKKKPFSNFHAHFCPFGQF